MRFAKAEPLPHSSFLVLHSSLQFGRMLRSALAAAPGVIGGAGANAYGVGAEVSRGGAGRGVELVQAQRWRRFAGGALVKAQRRLDRAALVDLPELEPFADGPNVRGGLLVQTRRRASGEVVAAQAIDVAILGPRRGRADQLDRRRLGCGELLG